MPSFGRDGLPPLKVLVGFVGMVVLIGLNFVAVRLSNQALAPTWGAALRFALAALILSGLVAGTGKPLPRGRALLGAVLFGSLTIALFFGLIYWGLVAVPAPTGSVIVSTVPLLTFVVAVVVGVERFQVRALVGALVVIAGMVVLVGTAGVQGASPWRVAAVMAAAFASATGAVVVKWFPPVHPWVMNAIGMTVAFVLLLGVSAVRGDAWVLPGRAVTWAAVGYLVLSSVVLFPLLVWVIQQWMASAAAYAQVLAPLVTVPAAAIVLGETVGGRFLVAAAVILLGVYLGTLRRSRRDAEGIRA